MLLYQKAVYDFLKFTLRVNAQISEKGGLFLELKSTFKIINSLQDDHICNVV